MDLFKKTLATTAMAAAIAFTGGAAQATSFTVPLVAGSGVYTGAYADNVTGSFADSFTFTLPTLASGGTFTLSSGSVTASSVITGLTAYLDNASHAFTILQFGSSPYTYDFGGLSTGSLSAGNHTIYLSGATGTASVAGTITLAAAAVPETATWAMMIGGIGFVGGAMRRRSVRTSVSFA